MMIPDGHTKIVGLIGSSIEESHSFALQNTAIERLGLNAVYIPLQGSQSNWESIFCLDNFLGANVTMPYKETLLSRMDSLTERAQKIGAINTIHKKDGQLVGDNTDSIGFLSSLEGQHISWTNRSIYVLGAGGAAKAICHALSFLGVKRIHVWNRNSQRIKSLTGLIPKIHVWDGIEPLADKAIIIQCTPLGQQGEDPLEDHPLFPSQIVLDLIYKPTPLIQRLRRIGGLAIDGGGMLVHQAAHSFARWFECSPPIESMTTTFTNIHTPGNTV